MALQIFGSNSIGTGTRANLTTADDVFVMAGVTIGSTDGTAISGTGSDHRVDIRGNVIAQSTAILLGDTLADARQEVFVRADAFVYGAFVAVWIQGHSSTVHNAGTIESVQYGVAIGSENPATTSTIVNTGTIESISTAIIRVGSGEKQVVTNSGLITGIYAYDANFNSGVEQITNTGRMNGTILLYGGDDLYDGRSGRLSGTISGGDGADRLYGGIDNDTFYGGADADTLRGYAGNDMLDGGAGADRMEGGTGNDKFFVDNAGDVVVELSRQGTDTVESIIGYTLTTHVENLILAGATAINGSGNSLANTITGNSGKNTLKGFAGNDKLTGNDGADKLYGGTGADQFIFKALTDSDVASSGRDTIYDFSRSHGDRIHLSTIDAQTGAGGNQAFAFIGKSAFSGDEGQLRYKYSGSSTIVEGDVDGNGTADFAILLAGKIALVKGDFVL